MGEYIDKIKEKARADIKTIVLPETTDKRTLIAASHIIKEGIANIILVGNEEKILDGAGWLDIELDGVTIVDPHTTDRLDYYIETLYELRKSKGMTNEKKLERITKWFIVVFFILVLAAFLVFLFV